MLKRVFFLILLFIPIIGFSQEFGYGFGFKGGLNYTQGGEVRGNRSASTYWGGTVQGEGEIGFHGGAFLQLNYGRFFVRPEAVYSSLELGFPIPKRDSNTMLSVETFTVPLLVGYNIYGPIDIYAGPVYSSVLNASIYGEQNDEPIENVQNTPFNAQAGIKVEFGRFGLDLRYEHSLSTEVRQQIDFDNNLFGGRNGGANEAWINDGRINQFIVSATFKLFGSGLNEGKRRRGRPCY